MAVKLNCWEFNRCGREPGGNRAGKTGVCPASTADSCSGLYSGKNGGRMCWAIAGTFAAGRITGAFAREFSCLNCDFLRNVCREEDICDFEHLTPYRMYTDSSRMFGRRNLMRLDVHLDMMVHPGKDILHTYIIGVTINFCRGGFSFISENFNFTSQGPVEFKIKLPYKNKYTSISGDVVWKTQVRDRCLSGVKIRNLNEEVKRDILDYSYSRWLEGVKLQ